MKKLSIYLETSIVGFLFTTESEEKRSITEKLFQEIKEGRFNVYISDLVLKELNFTKDSTLRKQLRKRVVDFQVLKTNKECNSLALEYIKEGVMPKGAINDAIHIAVASYYNLDLIISWNLKHIVKVKTRLEVNSTNLKNNYKTIEIATPEEVVENE